MNENEEIFKVYPGSGFIILGSSQIGRTHAVENYLNHIHIMETEGALKIPIWHVKVSSTMAIKNSIRKLSDIIDDLLSGCLKIN